MSQLSPKAKVFREYVERSFEAAAAAFQADPSSNNWHDLKVAMWAWQYVHGMGDATHSAKAHLEEIAARAKGDSDFSES